MAHDTSRFDSVWCNLPHRGSPRFTLPKRPLAVARSSLFLYHPATLHGVCGWKAARLLAGMGLFRLLPSGQPPPSEVLDAVAPYLREDRNVAIGLRPSHPGRYVVLILGPRGECQFFAKVATVESEREILYNEAAALRTLAPLLTSPLSAPKVLACADGVLLLDSITWRPRSRPWLLTVEVASAMGRFTRSGGSNACPAHQDLTPWNLLRTSEGWVLLDWEEATTDGEAFFDIFHYLVQGHALLGHPTLRRLTAGLRGGGWVGRALAAYAVGGELDLERVPAAFTSYLDWSMSRENEDPKRGWRGREVREKLRRLHIG